MEEKEINLNFDKIITWKHPLYDKYINQVNAILHAYKSEDIKNSTYLHKHSKEDSLEYTNRVIRTIRINYLRFFVDLNFRGIFSISSKNIRNLDSSLLGIKDDFDGKSSSVDSFMKKAGTLAYLQRQSYILIDNYSISEEDESLIGKDFEPYALLLKFENVINWSFDRYGNYNWVLLKLGIREDKNPFEKSKQENWFILYTLEKIFLIDSKGTLKRVIVNEIKAIPLVPVYIKDIDTDGIGESVAQDLLDIDVEIMNIKSLYNAELYSNLFNFLASPKLERNEEGNVPDLSETRILEVDPESRFMPTWLSPNINTLQEKREEILFDISEMIRIAGFKGKEESGGSKSNQTGISKLFDFMSSSDTLTSIVENLESAEKKSWYYFSLFKNGKKEHSISEQKKFLKAIQISYNKNYNLLNLDKEIETYFLLEEKGYSPEITEEIRKIIIRKIASDDTTPDKLNEMIESIKREMENKKKLLEKQLQTPLGFNDRGMNSEDFLNNGMESNMNVSKEMSNVNKKVGEATLNNQLSQLKTISRNSRN